MKLMVVRLEYQGLRVTMGRFPGLIRAFEKLVIFHSWLFERNVRKVMAVRLDYRSNRVSQIDPKSSTNGRRSISLEEETR